MAHGICKLSSSKVLFAHNAAFDTPPPSSRDTSPILNPPHPHCHHRLNRHYNHKQDSTQPKRGATQSRLGHVAQGHRVHQRRRCLVDQVSTSCCTSFVLAVAAARPHSLHPPLQLNPPKPQILVCAQGLATLPACVSGAVTVPNTPSPSTPATTHLRRATSMTWSDTL
jgi:hypothetical protein